MILESMTKARARFAKHFIFQIAVGTGELEVYKEEEEDRKIAKHGEKTVWLPWDDHL